MTAYTPSRPLLAGRRLLSALAALTVLSGLALVPARAERRPDWLTSRPRPAAPAARPLAVGDEVRTEARQRRRAVLPDGSVLYVNANSTVRLAGERRLELAAGEIAVASVAPVLVKAATAEVSAKGATFAVRTATAGVGVVVARGRVGVTGLERPLHAGQQLPPGADKPVLAPRVSQALEWTRDLMIAADTPLVPASAYAGGVLVAIDPDGQEAKLSLRKYHVDVHVEDGFARTTIDQTYFNHESARLEGTFYFPLPADASLSRLAMYVGGTLMEGGMAERDYARSVYESIVYRQKDPALLEWVDGTTFKMRVFPLEPRQEKRIILSYTQRLPSLYGQAAYRFPAGHSLTAVGTWSFHARVKNATGLAWASPSHALRASRDGTDLVLDAEEKDSKADRDVVLTLAENDGAAPVPEAARLSSAELDGAKYLMLRYRPDLPGQAARQRRDWVFLVESSGDRDPLLARAQIDVVQGLLAQAEPDDTFAVLAANTRVAACFPGARPVTPDNVGEALAFLEGRHLIGALDLGQALTEAGRFLQAGRNPYLVHVGSGIAAMGERRNDVLARRPPDNARYVGIGVGRRWARGFMKAAAERSGGYFAQINPDEPVSWRTFELAATLNTPRLMDARVTDPDGRALFLTDVSSIAQGEELAAVARLAPGPAALPERVTITGTLDGRRFERTLPVRDVAGGAGYLPRAWAKLEIDRLLAEDAAKHKDEIVALSKAMVVMTPYTSLLVLENEDMYEQYKVDRGRKDHWALYPCPAKITVVSGSGASMIAKPSAQEVLETTLVREPPRFLRGPGKSGTSHLGIQSKGSYGVAVPPFGGFPSDETIALLARRDMSGHRRVWDEWLPEPRPVLGKIQDVEGLAVARESMGIVKREAAADRAIDKLQRSSSGGGTPDIQEQVAEIPRLEAEPSFGSMGPIGGERATPRELAKASLITMSRVYQPRQLRGFANDASADEPQSRHSRLELDIPPRLPHLQMVPLTVTKPVVRRVDQFVEQLLAGSDHPESLIYRRPDYSGNDNLFSDLLAYAPGMNTTRADIHAVLDAEATANPRQVAGHIDPAARALIDRVRAAG
jgi:hypothetical protein